MATHRQRIGKINDIVEKELYDLEPKEVKNDTRVDYIENKVKKLSKFNSVNSKNTEDDGNILELVTSIIQNDRNNRVKVNRNDSLNKQEEMKNILSEIFSNRDAVTEDTDRIARYNDFRIIDEYIPEITDSLDVLRDSIMSPDDISKKSILYSYDGQLSEEIEENFTANMDKLFEKYNLEEYISNSIRETLLLGDNFTLIGKLANRFNAILNEKMNEEVEEEPFMLNESMYGEIFNEEHDKAIASYYADIHNLSEEELFKPSTMGSPNQTNRVEYQTNALADYISKTKSGVIDLINNKVNYVKDPYKMLTDIGKTKGYNPDFDSISKNKNKIDVNGVYFKGLNPDDVIKLEIDHVCIGYIVIQRSKGYINDGFGGFSHKGSEISMLGAITSPMNGDIGNSAKTMYNNGGKSSAFNPKSDVLKQGNTALAYGTIVDMLVKGISTKIDKKYIEDNKAFKDLIFSLVKTDYILHKNIDITFIPVDELEHVKIDSMDTYGVSRLKASLFPAKLYLSLLMTNIMVKVNQGRDRRVFYVDTGLDADYEANIEELIRDVKSTEIPSSSFGSNTSISTVLKTVGSLENFYIPTVNGERPFDIDTISGMQVDIQDELMDKLLKSAIIGTGVPYNYVDASQELDFARSLSMQNQGFVKKVVNYQQTFGRYFTNIVRKMYEYEFGKTDEEIRKEKAKRNRIKRELKKKNKSLSDIEKTLQELETEGSINEIEIDRIQIVFPEPILLNITTSNEQIEATNTTIDYITELYVDSTSEKVDEERRRFKRELARNVFMKNLDWDKFDELYQEMIGNDTEKELEKALFKSNNGDDASGGDDYGSY